MSFDDCKVKCDEDKKCHAIDYGRGSKDRMCCLNYGSHKKDFDYNRYYDAYVKGKCETPSTQQTTGPSRGWTRVYGVVRDDVEDEMEIASNDLARACMPAKIACGND